MKCFWFLLFLFPSIHSFSPPPPSTPTPPVTNMPTSYLISEEIWHQYTRVVSDVMTRPRVTQKLDPSSLQTVQDYLLSNRSFPYTPAKTQEQLQQQRGLFLNVHNQWTMQQYDYLTRCLGYVADVSAKTQSTGAAQVAWYKIQECGMLPRESTLSTFLYVLRGCEQENEHVATFHDAFYAPTEKTVTLRIQSLVAKQDPIAAEQLLQLLPCQKLRTFWPILQYYCRRHEEPTSLAAALRLFRHMRKAPGVILDADVYGLLLSALGRHGVFTSSSLEGIYEYGYAQGRELWNQLVTGMAEDLLELTPAVAQQIAEGFLDAARSTEAMEHVIQKDKLTIGRVQIDATTGKCPATGVTLRLMALTPSQRQQVHDTLLEMAGTQHEEYGAKLQARGKAMEEKRNGQYAQEQLRQFSDWLKQRETPYTAIVDGPNVAYFGHGNVHYSQVWEVVQELQRLGERPLVVMPQKYLSRSFWLSGLGKVQELNDQDQAIIDKLKDCMYVVPSTCLDDYYWMLASVAEQGSTDFVIVQQDQMFPLTGLRPLLITNDQMRDHRLALLEPRLFRRWTSCHIVNYMLRTCEEKDGNGKAVNGEECSYETKFFPAQVFSGEIQGNGIQGTDTMVWHFPVSGWSESERFCFCLRQ
ncbi:hypothetical protein FisN_32Hh011 [Fistulifera solaris]|uniref:ribonuclease P n=1 Tax=Fistulifera solaris TaxID=1519565 RepID=A0A1Z5J5P3_FISSO|nr:hypothetical protein FisN_32Hh011 [Fistulifera solaris]|eukprot:GAX09315.1 hypothetical protein FisN_32Hh011 [Fistulifera solaris]